MSRNIRRETDIPSQKKAEDVPDMAGRSEELETSVKVLVVARAALSVRTTECTVYLHAPCRYMYVMYLTAGGHNILSHDYGKRVAFFADRISWAPARILTGFSLECCRARRASKVHHDISRTGARLMSCG
jgi:hypothetical protein